MTEALHARLQAWREAGLDRIDPVGFQRIAALARRVDGVDAATREPLLVRLRELEADFVASSARHDAHVDSSLQADAGSLSALVERLQGTTVQADREVAAAAPRAHAAGPELLLQARTVWQEVRNERQLRQAREEPMEHAGPLNSTKLAARALETMGRLSPGYLGHFMAYMDALCGLDELLAAQRPASDVVPAAKRARPRKRKA